MLCVPPSRSGTLPTAWSTLASVQRIHLDGNAQLVKDPVTGAGCHAPACISIGRGLMRPNATQHGTLGSPTPGAHAGCRPMQHNVHCLHCHDLLTLQNGVILFIPHLHASCVPVMPPLRPPTTTTTS